MLLRDIDIGISLISFFLAFNDQDGEEGVDECARDAKQCTLVSSVNLVESMKWRKLVKK